MCKDIFFLELPVSFDFLKSILDDANLKFSYEFWLTSFLDIFVNFFDLDFANYRMFRVRLFLTNTKLLDLISLDAKYIKVENLNI